MPNKQTCILILGMHRSGTSAFTGVLNLLDIYLGSKLMEATSENEKGYFENVNIYKINDTLLSNIGSSWDDIFFNTSKLHALQDYNLLKKFIKKEFKKSDLFAIKDPRLVYLFPIYKQVLTELNIDIKIVIPYRHPLEVANSLEKRNQVNTEKGMLLWSYHFLLAEKLSRDFDRVFISFTTLLEDPESVIIDLSEHLGLDLKPAFYKQQQKILDFLEPTLKHHNIIDETLDNVPHIIQNILAQETNFNDTSVHTIFDTLYDDLFSYQQLFYNDEVQHRYNELPSLQRELPTLKKKLQTYIDLVEKRNGELQLKDDALGIKNQIILAKEKERDIKSQELQAKEKALKDKNNIIIAKEKELDLKNKELQAKEKALKDKDNIIIAKEKELHLKSKELHQITTSFSQTVAMLQSTKEQLTKKSHDIQIKDHTIDHLQVELTGIYLSSSWRATRLFRKLKKVVKSS